MEERQSLQELLAQHSFVSINMMARQSTCNIPTCRQVMFDLIQQGTVDALYYAYMNGTCTLLKGVPSNPSQIVGVSLGIHSSESMFKAEHDVKISQNTGEGLVYSAGLIEPLYQSMRLLKVTVDVGPQPKPVAPVSTKINGPPEPLCFQSRVKCDPPITTNRKELTKVFENKENPTVKKKNAQMNARDFFKPAQPKIKLEDKPKEQTSMEPTSKKEFYQEEFHQNEEFHQKEEFYLKEEFHQKEEVVDVPETQDRSNKVSRQKSSKFEPLSKLAKEKPKSALEDLLQNNSLYTADEESDMDLETSAHSLKRKRAPEVGSKKAKPNSPSATIQQASTKKEIIIEPRYYTDGKGRMVAEDIQVIREVTVTSTQPKSDQPIANKKGVQVGLGNYFSVKTN